MNDAIDFNSNSFQLRDETSKKNQRERFLICLLVVDSDNRVDYIELATISLNAEDDEAQEIVERLKYIKSGQFVPKSYGWTTLAGEPYFGSINVD